MNTQKEENAKPNIEQDAFDFVDLIFTGKRLKTMQLDNLMTLAKELKNNDMALQYINIGIKNLIYDTINGPNADLKKRLNQCYESLYWERDEANLPLYLKKLKEHNSEDSDIEELYNHVVDSYKENYEDIAERNITWQINDLYKKITSISKDVEINIKKDVYPDFITILGIFTAITFAIFGGTNLLSNIFHNIGSTPAALGQTMILAAIFGLIMWGIIELLFYWISKIKGIADITKDKNKKWFNWLAIGILAVILTLGILLFTKIIK